MKYKLIKTFPGSAELGTIIDLNKVAFGITHNYTNYPEFWELVKEPEFEILEFLDANTQEIIYRVADQMYMRKLGVPFHLSQQLKWVEDGFRKIHKIKRSSDGEIFSIGNKIEFNSETIKEITEISLDENPENKPYKRSTPYLVCGSSYGIALDIAKKAKTPLFTTEDGVDKFEGDDSGFWVSIDSYTPNISYSETPLCCPYFIDLKSLKTNSYYKRFSTKEAAQEYINLNKPRYSMEEVREVLDKYRFDFGMSGIEMSNAIMEDLNIC